MPHREAVIAAGYSANSAEQRATVLMRRKDVQAPIKAATRGNPAEVPQARMLPRYESSLALLQHTYNNPLMVDTVRIRAAEQALPYEHPRMGEQGKKEKAKDRAREITNGKRGMFAPKTPPQLTVVRNGN